MEQCTDFLEGFHTKTLDYEFLQNLQYLRALTYQATKLFSGLKNFLRTCNQIHSQDFALKLGRERIPVSSILTLCT